MQKFQEHTISVLFMLFFVCAKLQEHTISQLCLCFKILQQPKNLDKIHQHLFSSITISMANLIAIVSKNFHFFHRKSLFDKLLFFLVSGASLSEKLKKEKEKEKFTYYVQIKNNILYRSVVQLFK